MPAASPVMGRMWAKVDRSAGPDGCWPFTGCLVRGYGVLSEGRKRRRSAHRLALESKLGRPIRPGYMACHTCDNPPCCNPAHLYEGTAQDNSDDAVVRGRTARGHRRPDTALRVLRARQGDDSLTLDDPEDWAYWAEMDALAASAAVDRHVARVESGEGVATALHWYGDPEMSFVPSDLVEQDWPFASWGAA